MNAHAGAVGVALVAFAAGALLGREVLAPGVASVEERAKSAEAKVAELQGQVAQLTRERDAAAAGPARDPSALAGAGPKGEKPPPGMGGDAAGGAGMDGAAPPAPKPSTAARFAIPGYERLVDGIDWSEVGSSIEKMNPAVTKFAEEWAKTGKLPMELALEAQKHNAPLAQAAVKAAGKLGLDALDANSAFIHPAFQVNVIAATLEAAKVPLTDDQARSLEALATRASADDEVRVKGYDDRTWAIQKLVDESVLRDKFFEAALALLTPEQRDVLVAPSMKGRLQGDLFSSGLLWLRHCQLLPFADVPGLVTQMERNVALHFNLPDEAKAVVHDAVAEWAAAYPPEVLSTPADTLSMNGMLPVERVLDAARRQTALMQRIADAARMDDAATKKLRAVDFVLVPVRSK